MTKLQDAINSGLRAGHVLIGVVSSGLYSTRKGSNIRNFLDNKNISVDNAVILAGARAGQHKNAGYQWAIFTRVIKDF